MKRVINEPGRPRKNVFPIKIQNEIHKRAKEFVLKDLLPNPKINRMIIIGSSVKKKFGKYEKQFKNRIYSDIDVIVFVEDSFKPSKKWKKHFFCKLYNVYEIKRLEKKYLIHYAFTKKSIYTKKKYQKEAEKYGIALALKKSKHKYITWYEK